jgi:hypothetical protein
MRWLDYSSSTAYIVVVMVALAEELVALLILPAASLLGVAVSSLEMTVSFRPDRGNPTDIVSGTTMKKSLFTSTLSQFNYSISLPQTEDIDNVPMVLTSRYLKSILSIETFAEESENQAPQPGCRSVGCRSPSRLLKAPTFGATVLYAN